MLRNERLTVYLDIGDAQQPGLESDPGLAGLVAVLEGEGFRMQVAERESDEHLQLALHGRLEFTHSRLCLPAGHGTLEMSVLDMAHASAQGCDGDAEKGGSLFGRHLPDAAEIADPGGMKIEILRSFVVGHDAYSFAWMLPGTAPP